MIEPLLNIYDLDSYYGKSHIIHNLSLQVGHCECIAVLGRNGMGKTTLLRSILGLKLVTRNGSIRLNGEELIAKKTYEIARKGIGYIPQGWQLFPSLSVDEHLDFSYRSSCGNNGYTWTADAVYDLFPELAERKQISGTKLSGGEQQMLAIGRALVTNPTLILMDEPSEGLAPNIIQRVIEVCKHIANKGVSLLLIEQNMEMAKAIAKRVYIMSSGYIAYEAPMKEFAADRKLQHQYLGV
ncbi:MAG: ABC transporter ATP-binding protein [Actinomycetota bacterium]|nr:ABC transporter ATP-binding protein [Actinomycetota bacterium]